MIKKITTFILLSSLVFTPFIVKADNYETLIQEIHVSNVNDSDSFIPLIDFVNNNFDINTTNELYGIMLYDYDDSYPLYQAGDIIFNPKDPSSKTYLLYEILTDDEILIYVYNNYRDFFELVISNDENAFENISGYDIVGMSLFFKVTAPPTAPTTKPLFNDTTLSITLLILLVLSLGMYLIFKSNLILLPTIILWLGFIINTNNGLIVLFATTLFVITIVITFFKDKKGDNW